LRDPWERNEVVGERNLAKEEHFSKKTKNPLETFWRVEGELGETEVASRKKGVGETAHTCVARTG